MKRAILVSTLFLTAAAIAQQPVAQQSTTVISSNLVERAQAPSFSDMYCSGFITDQKPSDKNKVAGGANTPETTLYTRGTDIFIAGGGLKEGEKYTVIRELRDPNRYEYYKGQRAAIESLGQPYAELGQVEVTALRGPMAVAKVTFSCQAMTAGDMVVPLIERPTVHFRSAIPFERFPAGSGQLSARIVMANDFDAVLHVGQKVYISAGSKQGIKTGDYFRAVRGYDPNKIDPVEAYSYKAPMGEDTQKVPGVITSQIAKELPYRALGEMVVLSVTPTSSTAMITRAVDEIQIGDAVQLEGGTPAPNNGDSGN